MKSKFHLPTKTKKRQVAEVPSQTPYASPEIHQDDTGKKCHDDQQKTHGFPYISRLLSRFGWIYNQNKQTFQVFLPP